MRLLLSLFILFFMSCEGKSQPPIRVGVIDGAPFTFKRGTIHSGIAVDIWNEIALGLKRPYIISDEVYNNSEKAFDDLDNGRLDVLIGPISVTAERYLKSDFTIPYFIDKVIAVTPSNYLHNTFQLVKIFFLSVGTILLTFITIFAFYINLLWYYERSHTPKVPKQYKEGVLYLFWIHVLSGRHEEVPKSPQGKFLMLFQRSSFYIILIVLNATFISFLTISLQRYASPIQCMSDLERLRVGAIESSRSLTAASNMGIRTLPFTTIEEGMQALRNEQISAFLTDLSLADYYLKENNIDNLSISHYTLKYDNYVFVTRKGSPHLREINEQLFELRAKGIPDKICKSYLTKGIQNCDL